MYNRYVPQQDGSYQRSRMPEPPREPSRPAPPPEPPRPCPSPEPESNSCRGCVHQRPAPRPRKNTSSIGVGSFFRQLLPKNFDTEDLMIVLLLLLMAGDCQEDQNSALLTLALYLFM